MKKNRVDHNTELDVVIPEDAIIFGDELSKIYESEGLKVMALQGLELTVRRGEMMAIIGKSGSGKSTLLNMIGGLETPSAGQLYIEHKNIANFSEKDMVIYRSRTVGFVWQNSARNLFPYMTVQENVEAPMCFTKTHKKVRKERASSLLESVGMAAHADKFPRKLSGGEQQRVAIAVALANEPSILLADEPTGAVDTSTADKIFELLQKLNKELGLTIIVVTHDIGLANKVDRTVMISDGKISTEKLRKESNELHDEYFVLDKAHRLSLNENMLKEAGIEGNKVNVTVEDGKIVINSVI